MKSICCENKPRMKLLVITACLGFLAGCRAQDCTPGEVVDTAEPCEVCKCIEPGTVSCEKISCPPCAGGRVEVPLLGGCCGTCVIPEVGCEYDGVLYKFGEDVKTDNACHYCTCFQDGIQCATPGCMWCEPPGVEKIVEGACCPECHVCAFKGQTFKAGQFIDPEDTCQSCTCSPNGTVSCEPLVCPMVQPPCGKRLRTNDRCCQACKCRYKGNLYNPGTFRENCDGCECQTDGKWKCEKPTCPEVMCVDSQVGDDCCRFCPQGVTCMGPQNTVIKAGKKEIIGTSECICGEPWRANAYCAKLAPPSKKLKRANGNLLANIP